MFGYRTYGLKVDSTLSARLYVQGCRQVLQIFVAGIQMKFQKPQYEIFEQLPSGAVLRAVVPGLFETQRTLFELGERTDNECYAVYPPTQEIIGRVNSSDA